MADDRILLIGFMFYLLATVGAALSYTVPSLIIFRALQAIGVAVGSVAAITVIGDLFEGKMRGRSMGIYQMIVALGPGLGPIFGGIIGQYYGINFILDSSWNQLSTLANPFLQSAGNKNSKKRERPISSSTIVCCADSSNRISDSQCLVQYNILCSIRY